MKCVEASVLSKTPDLNIHEYNMHKYSNTKENEGFIMGFFKEYFTDVERGENAIRASKETFVAYNVSKKEYIDIDNLVKIILSWLIGGIVSLLPMYIYIWSNSQLWETQSEIWGLFFSNKDLFLVITTLTAGAMFEIFCSNKKGIAVYSFGAIGVILMVASLLIFSLLLFKDSISSSLKGLQYIGAVLMGICFVYSIGGYIGVCLKGR